MLQAGFPGQAGGRAIAEILFGYATRMPNVHWNYLLTQLTPRSNIAILSCACVIVTCDTVYKCVTEHNESLISSLVDKEVDTKLMSSPLLVSRSLVDTCTYLALTC